MVCALIGLKDWTQLSVDMIKIEWKYKNRARESERSVWFSHGRIFCLVWSGQLSNRNMRFMGLSFVLDPFHKHTL